MNVLESEQLEFGTVRDILYDNTTDAKDDVEDIMVYICIQKKDAVMIQLVELPVDVMRR